MIEFFRQLQQTHPSLWWAAVLNGVLLVASLAGLLLDARLVTGINPWIKPIKFEVSLILFLLTVGWLLMQLAAPMGFKRTISIGVALAMAIEIVLIVLQAARGVPSHFNVRSPLDGTIFGMMGLAIAVNTLLMTALLLISFGAQPQLAPAVRWGIRLGLVLFLFGSVQGTLMVRGLAHTVGAADGGAGLPFLNWSTRFGDLRVAHFVGMHAIQLLPFLGWWLSRADRQAGVVWVVVAFVLMLGLFAATLMQAMAARPILRV